MALPIEVCADCYYVWANGTLPDERTPGARPPWQLWEDLGEFLPRDADHCSDFSRSPCDACGCTWAGTRYAMTIVRLHKSTAALISVRSQT